MRILSKRAVVVLTVLAAGFVLSGCGSSSGLAVAKDVGESLVVDVAAGVVADCVDHSQPNNDSICRNKEEAVVKLGQSVYGELKHADTGPGAKELSEDLNAFIEGKRAPEHDNGDVTNGGVSSRQ
jgi:hypothetical protein